MKPFRLVAIRHGETQWARERRFSGGRDVPLTDRGRRQGHAIAAALPLGTLAAIYTSPLSRARDTADTIAAAHGIDVVVEPAFREMSFGAWEGLTRAEAAARWPRETAAWASAPQEAVPPGGERLVDVATRVSDAVARLHQRHGDATVAVVSHAVVIRLLVLTALGLGPARLWSVDASPAGISEIEYQGAWVTVHRMNTRSHLEGVRA